MSKIESKVHGFKKDIARGEEIGEELLFYVTTNI